jgi:hypothetical protein
MGAYVEFLIRRGQWISFQSSALHSSITIWGRTWWRICGGRPAGNGVLFNEMLRIWISRNEVVPGGGSAEVDRPIMRDFE